ncbi:MAG: M48 family metalloprotease [Longimicrobiales bacterium]|nr:M48 family metalloprotease [Longimicrobiales bacterium]
MTVREEGMADDRRRRQRARIPRLGLALLLTGLVGSVASCALNPATGGRQLSLISEGEEIQMGREAHPQILATFGEYPDRRLSQYVELLGLRMASRAERLNLPWTFTVVDDEVVNAFAVPGGFIYLTRGILAHFTSEAQLAAVLGHEIGHVTARHSVTQLSQVQLAQAGLGIGAILGGPGGAPVVNLAGAGFQVLSLGFSRDHERESDDLGYRYMSLLGYDPQEMIDVFAMLGRVGDLSGSERAPGWLSTHPHPEDRELRIRERIASDSSLAEAGRVGREAYLRQIDGLIYGDDPRKGYFVEEDFYHPELAFHLRFPTGWSTVNQPSAVEASSPERDAVIVVTLEDPIGSADQARRRFFSEIQGIRQNDVSQVDVNGLDASWASFSARDAQNNQFQGEALFVALDGQVYRILGYAPRGAWSRNREAVGAALRSFERETRPEMLDVEPARIRIVEVEEPLPFVRFLERYPSSIPAERVALLNQVRETEVLEPGLYKQIVGGVIPQR